MCANCISRLRVCRHLHQGHMLGAGSPSGSDTDISPYGIAQGHAYGILSVAELSDRGKHQLLKIRNPW